MTTHFGELEPTNLVLKRWAVSIGSGLPSDEWEESRRAKVPPLDDVTSSIVDRIHCRQPPPRRNLIRQWYLGCGNSSIIAARFGISRSTVYVRMDEALVEYRARFLESGHSDLIRLIDVDIPPRVPHYIPTPAFERDGRSQSHKRKLAKQYAIYGVRK